MESRLFESRSVGTADPKAKTGKLVEVLKTNRCDSMLHRRCPEEDVNL